MDREDCKVRENSIGKGGTKMKIKKEREESKRCEIWDETKKICK